MAAPCDWDVDPEALGVCTDWESYPEATRTSALELATLYLWSVTGRRFGLCPVTVRPSQTIRAEIGYRAYPVIPGSQAGLGVAGGPFLFDGRWFNAGCASACCGNSACAIVLRGPVAAVDEVLVDDDIIAPSAYRVDITGGVYLLVRVDAGCWPMCQNFRNDPGEEDTFEVTYLMGSPVPAALLTAAALLACEYAKALAGGPCQLPAKMRRLSRQGVEVELEVPDAIQGTTGIRQVDDIVYSLNPTRRQAPPVLLSLDLPESCDRVTVIPAGS